MIRSMSFLAFLSFLFVLLPLYVYAATQTLTTYYPAPQGNYKDMTINEGLGMVDIGSPPSVPCPTTSFFSSIPPNSNGNPIYLFNYTVNNNGVTGPALVVCINGIPYTLAGASGAQGLWQKGATNFIFPVQTAYNVGIGMTADPGFTLGVTGTVRFTSPGNTTIDGNTTLGSGAANIHTINGNVGIGITPAASAPRLQALSAGGFGTEPIRAQSNSTFFSGVDGSGAARFAINNDPGAPGSLTASTTLNFYGNETNPPNPPTWFNFMSVDETLPVDLVLNPKTESVTFLNGPSDHPIRFSNSWTGFPDAFTDHAEISNDTTGFFTLMIVGNKSAGGGRSVSVWDILNVNGTLQVNGNESATGTITAASDGRFKQNLVPLTNTLAKLDNLHGVSFEWNRLSTSLGHKEGEKSIGMVAQELQKVYPELVASIKNGKQEYLAVDYGKFTTVLLQSVKELKSQMKGMQEQIDALQEKVKVLEKQK